MKILTIRQPWAWLIVNGYKDVENRTWKTAVRGPILIHAAKEMRNDEWLRAVTFIYDRFPENWELVKPKREDLKFGGIVGRATIVDCVTSSDSQWFTGPFGFVLKDAKTIPFRPMKGALGFWKEKGYPL